MNKFLLAAAAVATATAEVHVQEGARTCGTDHDQLEIMASGLIAEQTIAEVCSHPELKDIRMCKTPEERARMAPVTIPVWYHVIHSGNTGRLTADEVQRQFEQTNKDFLGQEDGDNPGYPMDIIFEFAGVTYTDNTAWFNDLERYENDIKRAVAVDNTRNFNQYFGNFRAGLLGFCYFPNSFQESDFRHGCMNLYSSVPGGASAPFNEGKTTTHETGHGIGLFHTFQGGCNGGDSVADTNNQASATFGCPASRNSCSNSGPDPIHNYMDYSDDRCMREFTEGQNARANAQLAAFRPSLYNTEEEMALINKYAPNAYNAAKQFSAASARKNAEAHAAKFN